MKVNISGTISKDRRPDSGLDDIGEKMHANRLQRIAVVGIIEYHAYHDVAGKAETLAIRFAAIEPLIGEDDTTARILLDKARKARGVGSTELTLFDVAPEDSNGPWPGDPAFIAPGAAQTTEPADPPKPKRARRGALTSVTEPKGDDAA